MTEPPGNLPSILHRLNVVGQSVVVAVSGGADSVAMLRALLAVQSECSLQLRVAHFNHGLRGAESDEDARWVADLCERLGVVCDLGVADHETLPQSTGSREGDARRLRYQFLERVATTNDCQSIAVAHTADDQAETVLHRILRGTGLTGLIGIPQVRRLDSGVNLVRPLLGLRRQSLRQWLREIGQDFREDSTNTDRDFTRNRIRHDLLPLLEEQFNPQVKSALCRLAEQAEQTQIVEDFAANELLQTATIDRTGTSWVLDCEPLTDCPVAMVRTCLRLVWTEMGWPQQKMSFQHYTRLQEAICDPMRRGEISLPYPVQARLTRRKRQQSLELRVESND
ncbi:tRNA lysidine(34) synthetase TilS [Thalassoroseus pseudoceratinae]|uniref:tRNA lysidine(34) synthetase TilS n=1 Tax=Thalassoroseus pseudoceratinae TaxID=2713176 RepID=UPI001422BC9F|nr:tRNA lysidine(34) synthetase TilS [Thalassoroseus pseudoceratinae]